MQWLKYGCLGCLGLVLLVVVVIGGVTGVTWMQVRSEQVERQELGGDDAAETRREVPVIGDADPGSAVLTDVGRVVFDLDLGNGMVSIVPGEAGQPIHVAGEFDAKAHELEGGYEHVGETGWVYRVRLRSKGTGLFGGLRVLLGGSAPRLDVTLPPGVPMALEGSIAKGESRIELGGLSLKSVELELQQGAHMLEFSEPSPEPLDRFAIHGGQGAVNLESIGNASPRQVDVRHSMGALILDLRGPWRTDSQIEASASMGGFQIRLPDDVNVEGLDDVHVGMGEVDKRALASRQDPGPGAPTLRFDLQASMGGLRID